MKYLALLLALSGLFTLFILLLFQSPHPVNSPSSLNDLAKNQKILLSGNLIKDSPLGKDRLLALDSGFEIICKKCSSLESYKNKNISIIAFPEKFRNKTYLYALEIKLAHE